MSESTLVWRGLDSPRLEIARVRSDGRELRAQGTQIGIEPMPYELRYELTPKRLRVDIEGRTVELELDGTDFFDLESSPLFNSSPILGHDLHRGGDPRDFVMTWVSVPSLEVERSRQRYKPLPNGLVRFRSGDFSADIDVDEDGFVRRYPGLAERVWPR